MGLLWEWVAAKPGRALRHGDEFGDLVTALTWIAAIEVIYLGFSLA